MRNVPLSLWCALALILTCTASCRTVPVAYVPPKIDCAATDLPRARPPAEPGLAEKRLPVWQLYGWGWQAVAEDVLNQRADTAQCLQDLRDKGIIK